MTGRVEFNIARWQYSELHHTWLTTRQITRQIIAVIAVGQVSKLIHAIQLEDKIVQLGYNGLDDVDRFDFAGDQGLKVSFNIKTCFDIDINSEFTFYWLGCFYAHHVG